MPSANVPHEGPNAGKQRRSNTKAHRRTNPDIPYSLCQCWWLLQFVLIQLPLPCLATTPCVRVFYFSFIRVLCGWPPARCALKRGPILKWMAQKSIRSGDIAWGGGAVGVAVAVQKPTKKDKFHTPFFATIAIFPTNTQQAQPSAIGPGQPDTTHHNYTFSISAPVSRAFCFSFFFSSQKPNKRDLMVSFSRASVNERNTAIGVTCAKCYIYIYICHFRYELSISVVTVPT